MRKNGVIKHKRPIGHWIKYSNYLICSNCGQYSINPDKILDVCFNCGADMREEEEDE